MKFRKNSNSPRIIELYESGMKQADIARKLNITPRAVNGALAWHGVLKKKEIVSMQVSAVNAEDYKWLRKEARKAKTSVADFTRSILVDAIAEARGND